MSSIPSKSGSCENIWRTPYFRITTTEVTSVKLSFPPKDGYFRKESFNSESSMKTVKTLGEERTLAEAERIDEEMRRLIVNKVSPLDVRKALNLSSSSYYRHLDEIKREDQEWLKELPKAEFITEYGIALFNSKL